MRTASSNKNRTLQIIVALVLGSSPLVVFAQADSDNAEEQPTHGKLKFNTDDTPKKTDERPSMQFKNENPNAELKVGEYDGSTEDEGFKTYVGYPKHKFGVELAYDTVASDWNYNGDAFTFSSNTTVYNLNYTFLMTPKISMGLSYSHYALSTSDGQVTPQIRVAASSENFDDYYAKFRYCSISSTNFYRQLCYGVDLGNSAYPILSFASSTVMQMSRVQDVVLGLNVTAQTPFSAFIAKGILGFNYGTGLGSTGTLESKGDYDLFATAQIEYYVDMQKHHDIIAGVDYRYRNAKISGPTPGGLTDTWNTKLGVYGGRIGYAYMFP